MSDVSIVYIILGLVFLYLLVMIPININQTRIYTKNMMKELEAIHKILQGLKMPASSPKKALTDVSKVKCSWCRVLVPAGEIQRFGDVNLCPACAEMGGKRAIGRSAQR